LSTWKTPRILSDKSYWCSMSDKIECE
jgi:hypothetical protein